MRKLSFTTFAVLYAVLVLTGSAGRSFSWARKEATNLPQSSSQQPSHTPAKIDRSDSHLLQTKLTETEYVVECLKKAAHAPTLRESDRVGRVCPVPLWRSSYFESSRAPPSLI
jgi:hypothetical protein